MTRQKISVCRSAKGSDRGGGMIPKLFWRNIVLIGFLAVFAMPASAQVIGSQIQTLDQERFFNQSAFGKRVLQEIEQRSVTLATENRKIEAELTAEELALTERRKTLVPAEFRALADAFDKRVELIRTGQAQKANELNVWAETEQERFVEIAYPQLLELAKELGALVIIDQRTTIITSSKIDVTEQAIFRADQVIGDGRAAATETLPDTTATPPAEPAKE
ncbi:MAG TPA: outer membrane chaperone Skp [Rhodobacteraceae bacterium]|nr:outer membrane chaperone Skp [Paracoccaceae bacterium]